jgi:uncharacterized protein (DUF427 family)
MALKMRSYLMSSLPQLRYERTARRLRVRRDGDTLCDTTEAMLVWEPRRLVPLYAVPEADLRAELNPAGEPVLQEPAGLPPVLGPEGFEPHTCPGQPLDVQLDGVRLEGRAFRPSDPDLAGYVLLDFPSFEWVEEDQPAIGHPHDPFKRIDTLASSRRVVVSLDGQALADSTRSVALHETHLPTRWYLPRDDLRMDLLKPSEHRSTCAYKGVASYLSVAGAGDAGRDIAWTYPEPLQDALPVRDLVCFFSERTDLTVDDAAVARPVTPWSRPEEQQQLFDRLGAHESLEFG